MYKLCRHQWQHLRPLVVQLPRAYAIKRNRPSKNIVPADDVTITQDLGANFFTKYVGSNYWKWYAILSQHPELRTLKEKDVINTIRALKRCNFTLEDILTKPMMLYTNEITVENRYTVLKECGFQKVSIAILSKYLAAMNRRVDALKSLQHIPYDMDVVERLRKTFTDIELTLQAQYACSESLDLKTLRQNILNFYLQQRLDLSTSDLEKLWKIYGRIRHKSFHSVQRMVDLLINELHFSKERIMKNAFMLYGDPDNVRRIINLIPTIDGHDIKEILYKRPKILMSSCDTLLNTIKHIKTFGIGEAAIMRCMDILTLGSDTVLERLKDLNEIEEFQVLNSNPRVLRLVHYQNKARLRLDYLSQLKFRCASLHILSCGSQAFAKFARDGSDRTKGRDIVVYLSNVMGKPENDLRIQLSRHPNWCHLPALQVKYCYEFLLQKSFDISDIYNNIHLLLYPIKRIEEKLNQLSNPNFLEPHLGGDDRELTKNEILTLVLYLIESEFHFTGDGIWTEQHTQHVENFNNLLPDFPESVNKIYKYGVKAPTSSPPKDPDSMKDYIVN